MQGQSKFKTVEKINCNLYVLNDEYFKYPNTEEDKGRVVNFNNTITVLHLSCRYNIGTYNTCVGYMNDNSEVLSIYTGW